MFFTIQKIEKLNIAKTALQDAEEKLEKVVLREPLLLKDFKIESFIPETDFKFFEDRFFNTETKAWEEINGVMSSEKRHLNPLVELHSRVNFFVTSIKQCRQKIKELGQNV
jgi:hypothetical protein